MRSRNGRWKVVRGPIEPTAARRVDLVARRVGELCIYYPGWISFHTSDPIGTAKGWSSWQEALHYANFEAVMDKVGT